MFQWASSVRLSCDRDRFSFFKISLDEHSIDWKQSSQFYHNYEIRSVRIASSDWVHFDPRILTPVTYSLYLTSYGAIMSIIYAWALVFSEQRQLSINRLSMSAMIDFWSSKLATLVAIHRHFFGREADATVWRWHDSQSTIRPNKFIWHLIFNRGSARIVPMISLEQCDRVKCPSTNHKNLQWRPDLVNQRSCNHESGFTMVSAIES